MSVIYEENIIHCNSNKIDACMIFLKVKYNKISRAIFVFNIHVDTTGKYFIELLFKTVKWGVRV